MAEGGRKEREELQEAIRVQGELIRQLKLTEQTDEVKAKVRVSMSSSLLEKQRKEWIERWIASC